MSEDREPAVVRRFLESIGALDVDAALAVVAADLVIELPFRGDGGPRRMEGDEARRFIRSMPKIFSTLPFLDLVVEAGLPSGRVVAEYRSDGTTRTGRPYKNTYVSFFELRDDRITLIREYFDPNVVVEALRPA